MRRVGCFRQLKYVIAKDLSDFDWIWVAQDRNGMLACFVTAGVGPVPQPLLLSWQNKSDEVILSIEEYLLGLPILSSVNSRVGKAAGNFDSYYEMSKRGFFAFDWSDAQAHEAAKTGQYQIISEPKTPLNISSLSKNEVESLSVIKLPNVNFTMLDVTSIKA